jgi:hypothetical protein
VPVPDAILALGPTTSSPAGNRSRSGRKSGRGTRSTSSNSSGLGPVRGRSGRRRGERLPSALAGPLFGPGGPRAPVAAAARAVGRDPARTVPAGAPGRGARGAGAHYRAATLRRDQHLARRPGTDGKVCSPCSRKRRSPQSRSRPGPRRSRIRPRLWPEPPPPLRWCGPPLLTQRVYRTAANLGAAPKPATAARPQA